MQSALPDGALELPPSVMHRIEGHALELVRYRPDWDKRDLEQEAYLRCLTALQRYDGRWPIGTFLWKRVTGAMIDALRGWYHNRRGERIRWECLTKTIEEATVCPQPTPDGHLLALELRECLDALPWREAYVLERLYFGDATYQEVGNELGVTKSRIAQIHGEGLKRLRVFFAPP